jgi:tetratricopeptide (TPR) repeat protein
VSASVEETLGEATRLEKEYEWLQASGLYEQALDIVDEGDYFKRGEIQEKNGHSIQRAAFQAESLVEFREKMGLAVEAYEKAHDFYEKLAYEQGTPWMLRCRAISRYLSYWLATDTSEKKMLLDECLELEEKALKTFWDLGYKLEYGRTYNNLSMVHWYRRILVLNRQVAKGIFEKAIAWGERIISWVII